MKIELHKATLRSATTEPSTAVWRARLAPAAGRSDTALSLAGVERLIDIVGRASADGCRVLVVTGTGAEFCRGLDVRGVAGGHESRDLAARFGDLLLALHRASFCTVAHVEGPAIGGGVGLAASCDVVLAGGAASFALPEVMLGIVPGVIAALLATRVPRARLRRLAMMPSSIDVTVARELGLVDVCHESGNGAKALRRVVNDLLRCEPSAVAEFKQITNDPTLAEAVALGGESTLSLVDKPAAQSGIAAFVGGDPLPWHARFRNFEDKDGH